MTGSITLIGIGDDGCVSLTSRAINAVAQTELLAGATRHLEFFPQFCGEKLSFVSGLNGYLTQIVEAAKDKDICVLASGDPLFFGIGKRLLAMVAAVDAAINVEVITSPSSVQLACAKALIPSDNVKVISLHGRAITGMVARMQQGDHFALLTDNDHNPVAIARHLLSYDETLWRLVLCEHLGGSKERIREFTVQELAATSTDDIESLNVLLLQRQGQAYWGGLATHCPDSAYQVLTPLNGLITKAITRALVVARLGLTPCSVVWDIGSGSGSIAIEAAKQAWNGHVYALECNPQCFDVIGQNQKRHRVDNLTLVKSKAPLGLDELPAPDAVFVGGSRGQIDAIVEHAMSRLSIGGKLILSAITLDSVSEFFQLCKSKQYQYEVMMLQSSVSQPLAHYQRYQAENPIHLFVITKEGNNT
ncbi:Precorrin-6Y C(5,15)-methyltransferase (decarboxylating) [Shewanella sediminis HAW-EB3]|uniref:Precorrin-6Y C(5,15)-methyltransferase (Decarboxylating) n=1 Tax=Shewanella sediminis (strain HAW-EB3) TaxID=425104 RepID=A8FV18_SHESH|nr:bifunctional cobalt-precorrin-7 (C(5))-methyltransferase/cobalt-precorrin-6B (C(15))-methyltransferase [Shewanella sediminis]ABV36691.1 Precorrin-6Y C(5,15)-methyltransferase (decarboxylating) [Shewanella sediminis HAW-EB3]